MRYYSFWSGELQGTQEIIMENFEKKPVFSIALLDLIAVLKMRADFAYFKKRKMVDGELLPFDNRLLKNVFVGLRNSVRAKFSAVSGSEPHK